MVAIANRLQLRLSCRVGQTEYYETNSKQSLSIDKKILQYIPTCGTGPLLKGGDVLIKNSLSIHQSDK